MHENVDARQKWEDWRKIQTRVANLDVKGREAQGLILNLARFAQNETAFYNRLFHGYHSRETMVRAHRKLFEIKSAHMRKDPDNYSSQCWCDLIFETHEIVAEAYNEDVDAVIDSIERADRHRDKIEQQVEDRILAVKRKQAIQTLITATESFIYRQDEYLSDFNHTMDKIERREVLKSIEDAQKAINMAWSIPV
jgi:hypothetical protein